EIDSYQPRHLVRKLVIASGTVENLELRIFVSSSNAGNAGAGGKPGGIRRDVEIEVEEAVKEQGAAGDGCGELKQHSRSRHAGECLPKVPPARNQKQHQSREHADAAGGSGFG